MASNQIDLKLHQTLPRNRDIRQLAKACGDSVRDGAALYQGLDRGACLARAVAGRGGKGNARPSPSDGDNVVYRQRIAVDLNTLRHGRMSTRLADNSSDRGTQKD